MFALLPWLALILDLLALSLAAGFATRSIAAVAALAGIAVQLAGACPQTEFLPQILDAVALALIGPGAFSGDARLFGRSTIHLPR
ncbi:putative membrane protein YphA (DoxX/SURF4 family) [Sphingomonas leidyi]|uniref:Putative membrane protein YphA (DoxX/SURF4 family) n=2 Tax=Sphingomonas leidyi TaxID=68569 RepID=A0A7X5UYG8_9SPHN|nr:putative membrane protein YphA (DoxX/SURF4 family) [Sphingomonas leidyi]